jgi:hypothetical protein
MYYILRRVLGRLVTRGEQEILRVMVRLYRRDRGSYRNIGRGAGTSADARESCRMRRKAARRVRDKRGKAEKCGEAPGTRRLLERVKTVENLQNAQNHRVGRYTAYHILPTEIWTVLSPPVWVASLGDARIVVRRP